jgi:hypothetical protein
MAENKENNYNNDSAAENTIIPVNSNHIKYSAGSDVLLVSAITELILTFLSVIGIW